MTRKELIPLLADLGVRPNRKLGQNFLVDRNLLEAIVREAAPARKEHILEIGEGTGGLTKRLLESGCRVTAVEIDHRLAPYLRKRFAAQERFELIEADACDLDFEQIMGRGDWRCISNLPYAAGSVVLAHLSELETPPSEMLVLVQREVADRLCAGPDSKQYGMLSVCVGLVFQARLLRSVPPQVFYPRPQVASALVQLRRHEKYLPKQQRAAAAGIARKGFSQRRKQLAKLLAGEWGRDAVIRAFQSLGIPSDVRAEQLPVSVFVRLAGCLRAD